MLTEDTQGTRLREGHLPAEISEQPTAEIGRAEPTAIEVEDLTDEDVMQELRAAMHARNWVVQRRSRGFAPD